MYQSTKDKIKLIFIFTSLAITLIIGVIGIIFAKLGTLLQKNNFETIGFILIGIGLGGFFLIIVVMIVWSIIKNRKKD